MQSTGFAHWLIVVVEIGAAVAPMVLALGVVVIASMWLIDLNQKANSVLRNFPVVGHFRYWFLHPGEFFRQYLRNCPQVDRLLKNA